MPITPIDQLNLSYEYINHGYDISGIDGYSDTISIFQGVRDDILKEVAENFGSYMGGDIRVQNNIKKIHTIYDLPTVAEESGAAALNVPPSNEDDLTFGLLKFSKYMLPVGSGDITMWKNAVETMGNWFVSHVNGYSHDTINCDLIGKPIRMDCSGFVGGCLALYGVDVGQVPAVKYGSDSNIADILTKAGFVRYDFSWDILQPFDIMASEKHVEIYNGEVNGRKTSWAWGNYHPSLPCGTFVKANPPYNVIWRCAATSGFGFGGGFFGIGNINSPFPGAAKGKLPIPQGFYSDKILYEFITRAEGNVGLLWVTTYKGDTIATSCGINGWDFAGGVHSPKIARAIGVTAAQFASTVTVNKNSGWSRRAMGGEIKEGAAWGWATSPLPPNHPYWQRLIPYYRDEMIWAWNQPIIQTVSDPAERLAKMHSINWFGHHFMKGFSGSDSGYPHRLKVAREVCARAR